ncbi:MAG TPA: L,D-transpeptidase, partial [Brevundimonas sp.]|nr:L,D-transpeptidase [Brevundimonas sp.]
DSALSLHPVVTARAADRRLQRLASASVDDNRISYGCVNVPATFYEEIVQTTFSGTVGVVYILPESRPWAEGFFPGP